MHYVDATCNLFCLKMHWLGKSQKKKLCLPDTQADAIGFEGAVGVATAFGISCSIQDLGGRNTAKNAERIGAAPLRSNALWRFQKGTDMVIKEGF